MSTRRRARVRSCRRGRGLPAREAAAAARRGAASPPRDDDRARLRSRGVGDDRAPAGRDPRGGGLRAHPRDRARPGSRCSSWTDVRARPGAGRRRRGGPQLGLIKGGGGALLREKIVISAARRFVVVAETSKKVDRLGRASACRSRWCGSRWRDTRRRLSALLPEAELRLGAGGEPYVTDEGHYILDCPIPAAADPVDARAGAGERCRAWWSTASSSTWPSWRCWATRTATSSASSR